jgi:arginase
MRHVSLIPFVCGAGASTAGAEYGPLYCKDHGLAEKLQAEGIPAVWAVDPYQQWSGSYGKAAHAALPMRGSPERQDVVRWHIQELARTVADELRRGNRVVTIGGDHSLAAGSLAGAKTGLEPDATLGLVWVDAHPDLHTFSSSESKAIHGMPMGTLTGLDSTVAVDAGTYPVFQPGNIVYAGLRSIDEGEIENAAKLGLNLTTMDDLRRRGIAASLQEQIDGLMKRCDHILLSIDLDGFSDSLAPAVGTPVPGGFMMDEIMPTLARLVQHHSVPSIDIVEFNPTLPGAEKTYQLIVDILLDLLPRKSA